MNPMLYLNTSVIPDSAFTASSVMKWTGNTYPWPKEAARMGHVSVWCSKQNSAQEGEWIQVDLGNTVTIGKIAIQVLRY